MAVVMCHNSPDTTERIRRELVGVVDTLWVIDSGSDEGCRAKFTPEVIYCDNYFWTGCWNYAVQLFDEAECDVLWVIGGDIELRGNPMDYLKAIESAWPFGCWHPGVDGISRDLMQAKHTQDKPWEVWHLEGIAMAVSKEAVNVWQQLPKDNKLGWGMDIWMSWVSWKNHMRNILDGRVKIFHPDLRGYSSAAAHDEMLQWLHTKVGEDFRNELHFWSDDFSENVIKEAGRHGVSVVITSFNQRKVLELALAAFALQEVLPIEVIVADDGSTDGTLEWLDSLWPDAYPFSLSYITREHNGYNLAGAYNDAAQLIRGSRIIFTNADIIHNNKSVKSHMKVDDNLIGVGFMASIPLPKSKAVTIEHIQNPTALANLADEDKYVCNARIQGGNLSVPVDIFRELGGFSLDYAGKYGSETADLLERAAQSGHLSAQASLGESAMLSSCGFHLAHPPGTYKELQLGNKKYQREHLGVEA